MLDALLNAFRKKKQAVAAGGQGGAMAKRQEMAEYYVGALQIFRESVTDENVEGKAREFYALVKSSFHEALALDYEPTFQEMQKEIGKRRHLAGLARAEMGRFLGELASLEYGRDDLGKMLCSRKKERDGLLRECIADIESEGAHIKEATKRKIRAISAEGAPRTERELLIDYVNRLEQHLLKLF